LSPRLPVSLCPYLSLPICFSVYLSICLSKSQYIFVHLSICKSISLYIFRSFSVFLSLSMSFFAFICVSPAFCVFLCLSMSFFVFLCRYLYFTVSFCLSYCVFLSILSNKLSICIKDNITCGPYKINSLPPFCISVTHSVFMCFSLSFWVSLSLSLCLSVFLGLSLSVSLSLCLSISLSFCLSFSLSLCLSVNLCKRHCYLWSQQDEQKSGLNRNLSQITQTGGITEPDKSQYGLFQISQFSYEDDGSFSIFGDLPHEVVVGLDLGGAGAHLVGRDFQRGVGGDPQLFHVGYCCK
jgi:hypothetical protein